MPTTYALLQRCSAFIVVINNVNGLTINSQFQVRSIIAVNGWGLIVFSDQSITGSNLLYVR